MKTICCVIGTRPEVIKMAPLIKTLEQTTWAKPYVLATAQHREILDTMLDVFHIKVDKDLNIMLHNQDLANLTSRLIESLNREMTHEFDAVLAEGDTTTVLAAAIVCFYKKIPFGHVEAGLRTDNMYNPFPEEMNRVLASKITAWHFAPTKQAVDNLLNEGIPKRSIYLTGNTIIDSLYTISNLNLTADVPCDINKRFILITAHRRENFGAPLQNICQGLAELAKRFPDTDFIYPVHPNPHVVQVVYPYLSDRENIKLIKPIDYIQFVSLMKKAYFIISDSGGVEEEAPALGKPILVLRDKTERPEVIELGMGYLVGSNKEKIIELGSRLLMDASFYQSMVKDTSPYGDGKAAQRIIQAIEDNLHP
jgi:UDP-N-acetylglucosamine 2-epimerase (non-hydrolysing)